MIVHKYSGSGQSNLVPARDIFEAEFNRMNGAQRRIVLHSGWYTESTLDDKNMSREALNQLAKKSGVSDPEALGSKADVIAQIDEVAKQQLQAAEDAEAEREAARQEVNDLAANALAEAMTGAQEK